MSKKTAQPALYEKMRNRPDPVAPVKVDREPPPASDDRPGFGQFLNPGQAIRLPVGYLFLGMGILIALISVAYIAGSSRGKALEEQRRLQSEAPLEAINDPLMQGLEAPPATTTGKGMLGSGNSPRGANQPSGSGGAKPAVSGLTPGPMGPIAPAPDKDPRKKGLNYFILATTSKEGAVQLAEFCRSNGLETYVISRKNDRKSDAGCRVVAFPGFDGKSRSSPEVKALEQRIHAIGDKWKSTQRGRTDLHDAYPEQYGG